jgi:hypothetical protein
LARRGLHAEAVQTLAKIDQSQLEGLDYHYNAACVFSLSYGQIVTSNSFIGVQELKQEYLNQAIASLAAISQGDQQTLIFLVGDINRDPDLSAIRETTEFMNFMKSLDQQNHKQDADDQK